MKDRTARLLMPPPRLAHLAPYNAAVVAVTAVFLGLLKYNISNWPF
jgi:hypothetical protein